MSSKKPIVLFDIDYTLFDTNKFRELVYRKIAGAMHVPFDETFVTQTREAEYHFKKTVGYYEPKTFIDFVVGNTVSKEDKEKIAQAFLNEENYIACLYDDVEEVLQEISQKKDVSIGIFSTGQDAFQRRKIRMIKHYLEEEHIHIFANKVDQLEELLKKYNDKQIFLVDDFATVLHNAKMIRKNVFTIQVKRQSVYDHHGEMKDFLPDATVSDLKEIIPIIHNS